MTTQPPTPAQPPTAEEALADLLTERAGLIESIRVLLADNQMLQLQLKTAYGIIRRLKGGEAGR